MAKLEPGDVAPPFELADQQGKPVSLADLRGHKVLVYFYPEADTPGCTAQSCSLRDHRQDLAGIGTEVIGISPDLPDKQLAFDRKYGLGFPLLSDPNHEVAEDGAPGARRNAGASASSVHRSSSTRKDGSSGPGTASRRKTPFRTRSPRSRRSATADCSGHARRGAGAAPRPERGAQREPPRGRP